MKLENVQVPKVPLSMLAGLALRPEHWRQAALQANWQEARSGLETFRRHGALESEDVVRHLARLLANPEAIRKARAQPHQLFAAYHAASNLPPELREALQRALDESMEHVPVLPGQVWVCPDVSGSMASPLTGHRGSGTSVIQCVHAAALFCAAIVRRNPTAGVLPFAESVRASQFNPRDSVMTNAALWASMAGGGTDCSAPLRWIRERKRKADLVILVSDNQSWLGSTYGGGTQALAEWTMIRRQNPGAKLVCLDLQPVAHSQAPEGADVLNIGGFSDRVFDVIDNFARGRHASDLVTAIEQVELEGWSGP